MLAKLFAHRTPHQRQQLLLILLAAPLIVWVILFAVLPMLAGIGLSFYDYSLVHPKRNGFAGWENYLAIWQDEDTRSALVNTLTFMLKAVVVEFILGFIIALLLWRDSRWNRIILALLLVPVSVTPLAAGLIFKALFNPDYGPIGYFARLSGWSAERGFLGSQDSALNAIVFIDAWQWTPLMALILLAGLKTIPADYLEAAELDGASRLQKFTTIIFPVMLPSILLALLLRLIDASMVFDTIYVSTNGGPGNATNVLMLQAVRQGLEFFNMGAASAISTVMLILVGVIAAIFSIFMSKLEKRIS